MSGVRRLLLVPAVRLLAFGCALLSAVCSQDLMMQVGWPALVVPGVAIAAPLMLLHANTHSDLDARLLALHALLVVVGVQMLGQPVPW